MIFKIFVILRTDIFMVFTLFVSLKTDKIVDKLTLYFSKDHYIKW